MFLFYACFRFMLKINVTSPAKQDERHVQGESGTCDANIG